MKRIACICLFLGLAGMAEDRSKELLDQVNLVKTLLPDTTKIGIMIGEGDLELMKANIEAVQRQSGINLVSLALKDVRRQLPQYIRAATTAIKKHDVGALIVVVGKDTVTSNPIALKVVSLELRKTKVPVFAPVEKCTDLGCLGRFVQNGSSWQMDLNAQSAGNLAITLPQEDSRFQIN